LARAEERRMVRWFRRGGMCFEVTLLAASAIMIWAPYDLTLSGHPATFVIRSSVYVLGFGGTHLRRLTRVTSKRFYE